MTATEHWCPSCRHGAETPALSTRASQEQRRRGQLERFAGEHLAQPGRRRSQFTRYDEHLRLSCPVCDTDAGFTTVVDPVEARTVQRLMLR